MGHEDSEDVVQTTLFRVWKQGLSFKSEAHLRNYLLVAVGNNLVSFLRAEEGTRKASMKCSLEEEVLAAQCPAGHPGEQAELAEIEAEVTAVCRELEPTIANWLDPQETPPSYEQVAQATGRSAAALRTEVCRQRKRLRSRVKALLAA